MIVLLFLFSATLGLANEKSDFIIVTDHFPPYSSIKGDQVSGLAVDIVTQLMQATGYTGRIQVMPWGRVDKDNHKKMLFPFTRRPYREHKFKWIGPILQDCFVFVVRRANSTEYTDIQDFKDVRVGVARGTPTAERLRQFGFDRVQIVALEKLNARKLIYGNRIDAWYSTYFIIKHTLKELGIDENTMRTALFDVNVDMYIGATLDMSDALILAWQKELDRTKADGRYQAILEKNEIEGGAASD